MELKEMKNLKDFRGENLEKMIFKFSGFFSKVGSVIAIFLFVLSLFSIFLVGRVDTTVKYLEVKESLNPVEINQDKKSIEELEPNLKFSKSILKYLGGDNKQVLLGWLGDLEEDQQQDFLSNLDSLIKTAEKNSDDVYDVVNEYKDIKLSKFYEVENKKIENLALRVGAITLSLMMVLIVILLSVVLLLISIEKKARILISSDEVSGGEEISIES